jgi:hypothetical protein
MLQFTKELITPEVAKSYLQANIANRRVRLPVVLRYANDIINNRWKEDTAELIKISKTGVVLDGQHRLYAIIKANKPVFMHVAKNLDDSVFDILDTGSTRNASDIFRIKQVKNDTTIPSIIAMYNTLCQYRTYNPDKNNKSTNSMLLEQYYKDEAFWQSVAQKARVWYLTFAKILTPSYIGGFYSFFYKLNKPKAEKFFTELATGIDVSNKTVNLLRNKLMQDKMSPRKMNATLKMALIIKTWNCYIKGKELTILKHDSERDEFPRAISNNMS